MVAVGVALLATVVAVGEDAVDELLPHAAKSTSAPKNMRQNIANAVGLVVFVFLCIVYLSY